MTPVALFTDWFFEMKWWGLEGQNALNGLFTIYFLNDSIETMTTMKLLFLLCLTSPVILAKKKEPVCVEPLDGVAAYPCESRPSREPLSLQYSKAQSLSENFDWIKMNWRIFLVSKPAPSFEGIAVINGEFKEVSLNDFKNKYLVLLFYPLDL